MSIFPRHFNKILGSKTVTIFSWCTKVRRRNSRNFSTSLRVYQRLRTQDQSKKKQNKTKQNKTKENKTKQNKTKTKTKHVRATLDKRMIILNPKSFTNAPKSFV